MGQQIWTCLKTFGLVLLASNIVRAQTNTSEVVKTTLFVSDETTTTEQPIKVNETISKPNETVKMEMLPITQPIAENISPTQQIGRTLFPVPTNISNNQQKSDTKPINFRPSQQLDTYYEYNRFPVVPAFPEAKHFSGINLQDKPIRSETLPWLERPNVNFPTTTQQPWYNKINFPTTQNPYMSVRDHPYPYLITGSYPETTTRSQYQYIPTGANYPDLTTRSQFPYAVTGNNYETTTKNPGFGNAFSKFGGYPAGNSASVGNAQNGFNNKFGGIFDKGGLFDKGSLFGSKGGLGGPSAGAGGFGGAGGAGGFSGAGGGGEFGGGGSVGGFGGGSSAGSFLQKTNFEQSNPLSASGGASVSPWKKIIKFLTAFIPIGLLLSALTPTVINVTPMNMTGTRGRAEHKNEYATNRLVSSLNYINKLNAQGCEERVVCELLMGAGSSENAEKHLENLLEAFTEQERDVIGQIEELKKIFYAVRTGTCSSLSCEEIPNKAKIEDEKVADVHEEAEARN